jgi:type I restriction enzyme M protein
MCAKKKPSEKKELTDAQDLYSFLYGACDIIRGPVSHENFKDYITPLLYFKRISDVWDEERDRALEESGGDEEYALFPEQHRFVIPDGCHWDDIRNRPPENLGAAIVGAMRQIELANPKTLYGILSIFGTANWTDKTILSDGRISDLLNHFSKRHLGNRDYPADLMGDAYEILLKKFADESKKKAGEFYTPRSVVRLLVRILDPQPGERVYDPACGSGGMLIEAIHHMHNDTLCCGAIYGQEKNVTNAAVAKMNLFLHGAADFDVIQGDTLRNPKIVSGDQLARFECVIANPPFSLDKWGAAQWTNDRYGRNIWGTPPDSCGDFAWLQHMVASMAQENGRVAVVLPQGVLFRGDAEGAIREKLVKSDLIEAVIALGERLFYGAGIAPCVLILRRRKKPERVGKMLMLDGSKIFTPQRAQNELSPADVDRLYDLYSAFSDQEDFTKVATVREVEEKGCVLSPNRYVAYRKVAAKPYADVKRDYLAAVEAVRLAEKTFEEVMAR